MVGIRRQKHVLREIDLHAMAFPNGDGWRNLYEAVKDGGSGLRNTGGSTVGEALGTTRRDGPTSLRNLARSGDYAQSNRGTEDLKVVVVDLVFQPFFSDLIEALELVEINGIPVRHNQAVKDHGHSPLLAKARGSNLLCFAQDNGSFGNDDVLMIVRIQRI